MSSRFPPLLRTNSFLKLISICGFRPARPHTPGSISTLHFRVSVAFVAGRSSYRFAFAYRAHSNEMQKTRNVFVHSTRSTNFQLIRFMLRSCVFRACPRLSPPISPTSHPVALRAIFAPRRRLHSTFVCFPSPLSCRFLCAFLLRLLFELCLVSLFPYRLKMCDLAAINI